MTTIRKIVTSQVDGDSANNTSTGEIRPFGETAFYLDTDTSPDKLVLMMFNGTRTHRKSKVLSPGELFGSNADSGDGANYDTIKLIPDADLKANGSDQYLIVDPTAPNHIHIRAGGTQDNSSAQLFVGGESSHLSVGSGANPPIYITANSNLWTFGTDAILTLPVNADIVDSSGKSVFRKTIQQVTVTAPTAITGDIVFADPNAAGNSVNLVLPSSPFDGTVITVKNINSGGNSVIVQTDGLDNIENEGGSIGNNIFASISVSGSFITWIYEESSATYRIIGK